MLQIIYRPPASQFLKKIKDKALKKKFEEAINKIRQDPTIGEMKVGELAGIFGYDIYYSKTNYEIAYILDELPDGTIVIILMAGTRENFWDDVKRYIR